MRAGETDPELRRFVLVVFLDDGVTPATDADTLPSGAYAVSVNGAAPGPPGGNFVGDGTGEYYYELSAAEAADDGFVAFRLKWPGYQTVWQSTEVGDLFTVGETDPTRLRLPLLIYDDQSPPQLALATVTAPSQLQTSLNDVSFADALGTLHQVADGLHYYQGVAADAAAEGTRVVRFEKTGFQREVAWTLISAPASAGAPAMSLISISPTPGVAPGDPGGFPPGLSVAAETPVAISVAHGASNLDRLLITARTDGEEEVVYYAGAFRGRYVSLSSQLISGDDVALSIRRVGGWVSATGDLLVTVDNVPPTLFLLRLPAAGAASVALASAQAPAGIDHVTDAVDRLPRQFRKPKIEALVQALSGPFQLFETILQQVLSSMDVRTAVDSRLKILARRVGQEPSGLSNDDLRRLTFARIAVNRSSGSVNQLTNIIRLVLNAPAADVTVEDHDVATAIVTVLGVGTPTPIAIQLLSLLKLAKSSSVRLVLNYVATFPLFRLDSGPGFDQGHLISSIE